MTSILTLAKNRSKYFRNDFRRAFELTFWFLASTSRSRVTRGGVSTPPPPSGGGKSRGPSGCGLRKVHLSGKQGVFQIGVLHRIQASRDIVKGVQSVHFWSEVLTTLYVLRFMCHHVTQSLAIWILYSSVFVPCRLAPLFQSYHPGIAAMFDYFFLNVAKFNM